MARLTLRRVRKLRSLSFSPSLDGFSASRLEARSLTTGYFYRDPNQWQYLFADVGYGTPSGNVYSTSYTGGGLVDSSPDFDTSTGSDRVYGEIYDEYGMPYPSGDDSTIHARVTTTFSDGGAQPTSGSAAPVGSAIIAENTCIHACFATIQDPWGNCGIVNFVGADGGWTRNFLIADDGTGGSTNLVEHYSLHYAAAPGGLPGTGPDDTGTYTQLSSSTGLFINWEVGEGVTLGSTFITFSAGTHSGSFTDGEGPNVYSYTYTASTLPDHSVDLDVTYTVPYSSNDMLTQGSTVSALTGYGYSVTDYTHYVGASGLYANSSTEVALKTHFDATFT